MCLHLKNTKNYCHIGIKLLANWKFISAINNPLEGEILVWMFRCDETIERKKAIIIGGSVGIGFAIAKAFVKKGA